MDPILQNKLYKAEKGRAFWIKLMESTSSGEVTYVILIPDGDIRDAYLSLFFLEDFIREKNARSVLILSANATVREAAPLFCNRIRDIIAVDRETEEAILAFYCLYEFSNRLIIASLSEPQGRRGAGLVRTGIVCYAETFAVIVYGLSRWKLQNDSLPVNHLTQDSFSEGVLAFLEEGSKNIWKLRKGEEAWR